MSTDASSSSPAPPHDVVAGAAARLEAAQDASDQERLSVLDELYAALEAELDKDFEQAGPSGR